MGTPCFAGRILERVLEWPGGEVVGVFSQPDRPCGRGLECRPCEVKTLALERGLPVFQPERFRTPEAVALVRDLAADAILVAAYGLILPLSVLEAAPLGCINVHASLLPRHRGAAPIQRALLNGETSTGVTIMQMDEQMDHGPILLQRTLAIGPQDTSETLHDALADLGGRLLAEALDLLALGRLTAVPQDHQAATYAPKLVKEDGLVDFARPASCVHDQVRGVHPWPGAYCVWDWNGLPGREPPAPESGAGPGGPRAGASCRARNLPGVAGRQPGRGLRRPRIPDSRPAARGQEAHGRPGLLLRLPQPAPGRGRRMSRRVPGGSAMTRIPIVTGPPDGAEGGAGRSRRGLFVALILGTALLLCLGLAGLWIVPYVGLPAIHPWAPALAGGVILALILLVVWATAGLVLNILLGKPVIFSRRLRGLAIKLFLPLMTVVGRLAGLSKDEVRQAFIRVNNDLVLSENHRHRADKILLLMPHCLQRSDCAVRLTYDIRNCKRCGRCPIHGLIGFADRFGVKLAIATGGTIARRIVVQNRPRLIVAVACERDLASGIQDTYPLPVYGVLNERPHGPCLDTLVDLERLEQALLRFLDKD